MLLSIRCCLAAALLCCGGIAAAQSPTPPQAPPQKPEWPPIEEVTKGYEQINSTADGGKTFYTVWVNEKEQKLLCELPRDFAKQKHFIALTVSSGTPFAGLQTDDMYVYWRQHNKRLALIAPNLEIRSNGEAESKRSVERLFTDKVLLDVPIVSWVPRGGPVIDMGDMLVKQASVFYGTTARTTQPHLARIVKSKAFPQNVELAFEIPGTDGILKTFHYSWSLIPETTGYQHRTADERIGYFTTHYADYGKYDSDEVKVRFINRWHLEKRDPSLKLSPPKEPIVFYLEHTTPVRYRRWVRDGVLLWNKAFEKVGILNAIEVRQQDSLTGAYMDIDPEDVRYNFVRWLNNNVSTAIGPSRVHPMTGQILDADIVLTDGWIRTFDSQFDEIMPKLTTQGMSPETLAWLAEHPDWDPRIRLAQPSQRQVIRQKILHDAMKPYAGHEGFDVQTKLSGDDPFDGLLDRTSQVNGACMAADGRAMDIAYARMSFSIARMMMQEEKDKEEKDKDKKDEKDEKDAEPKEQMLDGMPESFIGPLLADLVCHEVGHTLGLRHNFKASSIYTLAEINSAKIKGKPMAGSVMDYLPVNFNFEGGEIQGDYAMTDIGPYDRWAIEYGYSFEKDLKPILSRVAEPELVFATDDDTSGPDPLARRYDFSKNPLDFAKSEVRLAKHHRNAILEKFVDDGESWSKARRGYTLTLSMQVKSVSMMANWIGGSFVNRDRKGDPNARTPIEVVPTAQQREALNFVIENTFFDEAFGLTPDLINHMTVDQWTDERRFGRDDEPTWPVHDRIMGIQASTLTQLMNPTVLRRVYDNEFRIPADQEALTLPELMNTVKAAIWKELESTIEKESNDRKPLVSSMRRNLQTEHLERLFDLANQHASSTAAFKPIANLATMQLNDLSATVENALKANGKLDAYTRAHLQDAQARIKKWREAQVVVKESTALPTILFGETSNQKQDR
jgi:hypothetical protein